MAPARLLKVLDRFTKKSAGESLLQETENQAHRSSERTHLSNMPEQTSSTSAKFLELQSVFVTKKKQKSMRGTLPTSPIPSPFHPQVNRSKPVNKQGGL